MEPPAYKSGISSPGSSQAPSAPALKNFTIPRKKRGDGIALVEPCPKESRDYSFILRTLSESCLDTSRELQATWQCDHVKLIHNQELLTHFSDKRSELRSKERHARELEERFCFLVTSPQKASQIYQHGLTVQDTNRPCLGKPSHGICLYRHADVALRSASAPDGKILIVFKVLLGKVKKVVPVFGGSSHDPTIHYDCHVAKDSANPRESLSQQATGSSVFLFDYNNKQELNIRPRQCLPYAAVSFIPIKEAPPSVLATLTIPSPKPTPVGMELKDSTKTCTMGERRGWGQNAQHVGTQEIPIPGQESKPPTFQRSEHAITHCGTSASNKEPNQSNQNEVYQVRPPSDSRIPRQIPPFNTPLTLSGSKPFIEWCNNAGPVHPHIPHLSGGTQMDQNTQQSSKHVQCFPNMPNLLSVKENNQQQPMTTLPTTGVTEKVSSVVYCSRVIKDPRMHRRASSNTSFDLEGNQTDSNTSRHESVEKPELKTVTGGSNEENKIGEKTKDKQSDPLANTADGSALKRVLKKQPPYQMLRIKFRKYAAYLRLSKQERKEKIQSLQNFSSDQKCMLSERINFYDAYFQKYKKGELVQNDGTTVDPAVSCKAGSEHIPTGDVAKRDTIQSSVEVSCSNVQQQASVFSSRNDISCHQNSNLSPTVSLPESLFHNCLRVQGNPSSPLEQNSEKMEPKDTQDINQRDQRPDTLQFTGGHGHRSTDVLESRPEKQDCNFDKLHGDQKLCTRFPGESEDSLHSENHDTAKILIQETDQNVTSRDGRKFCEQSLRVAQVHTDSISQPLPYGSGEDLGNNTREKIQTVSLTVNSERDQQSTNQTEHPLDMIPEGNLGLEETRTEIMAAGDTTFQDDVAAHCGGSTKVIDMELDSDLEEDYNSIPGSSIATGNEMRLDSVCSMVVHGSTVDQKLCTRFPGESEDSLHSENHDTAKILIQETDQNVTSRDGRKFCEQSLRVAQVHTDSISQPLPYGSGEDLGNNTREKIQTVSLTVNSERDQQSTNQTEHPLDMIPEGNLGLEETRTEIMAAGDTTFQDDVAAHCGGSTKVIDMELDSDLEEDYNSIPGSSIATGNEMRLDSVCSMVVHGSTVDQKLCTRFPGESEDSLHSENHDTAKILIQETDQNVTSRDGRKFCEQSLRVAQVHTDSISQPLPYGSGEDLGNNTCEKIQTVSLTVNSERDQQSTNQTEHPLDMIPEGNLGLEETRTEIMAAGDTTFQDDVAAHCGGSTKVIDMELDSDLEEDYNSIPGSTIATGNEMRLDSVCSMVIHGSTVDAIKACEEVQSQKRERECNTINQPQEVDHKTLNSMVTKSDHSQIKDAIYIALCSRLQLSHLCPSNKENTINLVSGTHYLKPTDINTPMDSGAPRPPSSSSTQVIKDKHHLFSVTVRADGDYSYITEFPPLSKRFAIFGPPQKVYSSLHEEKDDKISHSLIKVLNSTTTFSDGLHANNSTNAKLIKILAEKYNGKENSSFHKLSHKPRMSLEAGHSISKTAHPEGSQTSNKTKTRHIEMPKKYYTTNRRRSTRENASNNLKSASSVHRISKLDLSRVGRSVAMKPRRCVIMKMMKGFRRSNTWWTLSHRFNSNRMQCQGKQSNGPARSAIQKGMLPETKELLGCGHSKIEQLKWLFREQNMNLSANSVKERVCALLQATDGTDASSTSTINLITEKSVEHTERSQVKKFKHLKPTQETEYLPQSTTCSINPPWHIDKYQVTHSSTGDKLNAIICSTLSNQCFESNKSPINLSKHKENLSQETTKQADKHSHEEVKDNGGPVTNTGESLSASEIMEYPLDTAIEIICGSGVESGSAVSYSADVIQTSVTSEGSGPSVPLEADDKTSISSKELKLISRLRDFLTTFETTVKTDKAMDLHAETTGEDEFHIHQEAHGMEQQSVELVVLDRVELPSMRQSVSNPMMKLYDKELVIPKLLELEQQVGHVSKEVDISNINLTKVENSEISTTGGNPKDRDSIPCISPDSTSMLVTPTVTLSKIILDKGKTDVYCSEVSTSVPDNNWATTVENSKTSGSRAKPISNDRLGQLDITEIPEPSDLSQKQDTSSFYKTFTVADISKVLKEGDQADSMVQLSALRTNCKVMLHHFITHFERRQNVQANKVVATRDLILEQYLELPPVPVDLKYEALNSFLELQMMFEAWQFIDNKMRYISGHATFRSLLWYDPSLYGELFKGKVGFQQQSSLYTSFQQTLTQKGTSALQRYHSAVCMLHQQLQKNHELSYYMYLKSKRERLEVEAVLRKPAEVGSFFLSVPLSCMINLGDDVESLQRMLGLVSTFTETPADRLEGVFDIGKAENLAMMCRFLQEKISYLKTFDDPVISKVAWFGMEHLLYDASKILVWRDSRGLSAQAPTVDLQTENHQIVYGKTETGASLLHARLQKGRPTGTAKISSHKSVHPPRGWQMPTEKKDCVQNQHPENGPVIDLTAETTSTGPTVSLSKGRSGVYPFARPPNNIAPNHQPTFRWVNLSKSQSADHADKSQGVGELNKDHRGPPPPYPKALPFPEIRSCLMKAQNRFPMVRESEGQPHFQQQWPPTWRPSNATGFGLRLPPTPWSDPVRDNGLSSRKRGLPTFPPQPPFLQQPPLMSLVGNPSQRPLCSLQRTANHVLPLSDPVPPNYPFFLLNGQTYSTTRPALPTTLRAERRFHPYPT